MLRRSWENYVLAGRIPEGGAGREELASGDLAHSLANAVGQVLQCVPNNMGLTFWLEAGARLRNRPLATLTAAPAQPVLRYVLCSALVRFGKRQLTLGDTLIPDP